MMAIDYDASDGAPLNETVMCAYNGAVETSVWNSITLRADPRSLNGTTKTKYIRDPDTEGIGLDRKLYDSGTFFLAMDDGPGTAPSDAIGAGKVWAEYDITFYDPQLNPGGNTNYYIAFSGGANVLDRKSVV